MARHVCGLDCIKLKKGRLYHACKKCKHHTETPIAKSQFSVKRLTRKQKSCASRYIPEMIREEKRGRWTSRKQAIAVGLSKARSHCG